MWHRTSASYPQAGAPSERIMPSIPLPFVTALLLIVLLTRMVGRDGISIRPLSLFVALCAVQAIVLGLRWNFDWSQAHLFQPILAATLPPLAWLGFEDLRRPDAKIRRSSSLHAIPVIVVAVMVFVWSDPIDMALIVLFLGYGCALLWAARQGPDTLSAARFGDASAASRTHRKSTCRRGSRTRSRKRSRIHRLGLAQTCCRIPAFGVHPATLDRARL